jgi:hypothetical protein
VACVAHLPSCRPPARWHNNVLRLTDDDHHGSWPGQDLHSEGTKTKTIPFVAMVRASKNDCICILFLSYADGVEPFMSGDLATCTQGEFSMDKRRPG